MGLTFLQELGLLHNSALPGTRYRAQIRQRSASPICRRAFLGCGFHAGTRNDRRNIKRLEYRRYRTCQEEMGNAWRQCGNVLVAVVQSKTEKPNKEQYQEISTKAMS